MTAVTVFANDSQFQLVSGGTTAPSPGTVETWTVLVQVAFPSAVTGVQQFLVADQALGKKTEKVLVTSGTGTVGTQTWTVTRGAEGTATVGHTLGDIFEGVVSSGWLNNVVTQMPWNVLGGWSGSTFDLDAAAGAGATNYFVGSIHATAVVTDGVEPFSSVWPFVLVNQGAGSGALLQVTDAAGNLLASGTNVDTVFSQTTADLYEITLSATITPAHPKSVYYVTYLWPFGSFTTTATLLGGGPANWQADQTKVSYPSWANSLSTTNTSIPNPLAISSLAGIANAPPFFGLR